MNASTLKTGTAATLALVAALALAGCNKTADNSTSAMPGSSSTSPSTGSMGSGSMGSGSMGSGNSTGSSGTTGGMAMPPASAASGSGG